MKMLSLNLWYEKYGNKTRAQLKSFRRLGFSTHVATIVDGPKLVIYDISDAESTVIWEKNCSSYKSAFRCLRDYCIRVRYDIIYIRRLMSKLLYALPFIKGVSKVTPLVYEIPTYPLDTGNNFLYAVRDFLEFKIYKLVNPFIKMTLVNLIDDISIPENWTIFHNGIDIDNYDVPEMGGPKVGTPEIGELDRGVLEKDLLGDTIKFIMVANISEYHHYERMLYAMKEYVGRCNAVAGSDGNGRDCSAEYCVNGDGGCSSNVNGRASDWADGNSSAVSDNYRISLTVISPDSPAYDSLKRLATELGIAEYITFLGSLPIAEIQKLANSCHIGVGQLSDSSKGSNLVNTLKSKDYCAMGIPFFSTCYDTSFEKDFPYIFVTEDMDSDIDLSEVIGWFLEINKDPAYRQRMYDFAKENLQYDSLAREIVEKCGVNVVH